MPIAPSLNRYALPCALSLLFVFAACDSNDEPPQPATPFEQFDVNSDGVVEFSEFGRIIGNYSNRDEDGNGEFSREEFENLVLRIFDPDANGISESEFEAGAGFFINDDQTFDDYDADGDETIQEDEFTDSFDTAALFDDLDTSGDGDALSPSELAQGFFDIIDRNGDAALNEDEFNGGVGLLFGVDLSQQ